MEVTAGAGIGTTGGAANLGAVSMATAAGAGDTTGTAFAVTAGFVTTAGFATTVGVAGAATAAAAGFGTTAGFGATGTAAAAFGTAADFGAAAGVWICPAGRTTSAGRAGVVVSAAVDETSTLSTSAPPWVAKKATAVATRSPADAYSIRGTLRVGGGSSGALRSESERVSAFPRPPLRVRVPATATIPTTLGNGGMSADGSARPIYGSVATTTRAGESADGIRGSLEGLDMDDPTQDCSTGQDCVERRA
ncbi:MAG: hypothetical protein ACI9MR_003695 [Myxococcota bacterium]|jgi:hypothetical protein